MLGPVPIAGKVDGKIKSLRRCCIDKMMEEGERPDMVSSSFPTNNECKLNRFSLNLFWQSVLSLSWKSYGLLMSHHWFPQGAQNSRTLGVCLGLLASWDIQSMHWKAVQRFSLLPKDKSERKRQTVLLVLLLFCTLVSCFLNVGLSSHTNTNHPLCFCSICFRGASMDV